MVRTKVAPLKEQAATAPILCTLDDKIELNRRMNTTLEEMARTIFKGWFVDFDPVRAKAAGCSEHPRWPTHRSAAPPWNSNRQIAYGAQIIIPDSKVVECYDSLSKPVRDLQHTVENQSRILAAPRDAPVPKLISRAIRVKDSERFLKERGL
jgi:hypothetical protein